MKRFSLSGPFLLAVTCGLALAQTASVDPVLPSALKWASPPQIPGLRGAWVLGSESGTGTYVQRVILQQGARIPLHTHPDTRYSTVLSGTLYVSFGNATDDRSFVAVPAGGLYVAPANQPHTLWARDGEVVYQEAGTGPTGTAMVPAP
jgi:quercetin dioxygenase-like cupin family protein